MQLDSLERTQLEAMHSCVWLILAEGLWGSRWFLTGGQAQCQGGAVVAMPSWVSQSLGRRTNHPKQYGRATAFWVLVTDQWQDGYDPMCVGYTFIYSSIKFVPEQKPSLARRINPNSEPTWQEKPDSDKLSLLSPYTWACDYYYHTHTLTLTHANKRHKKIKYILDLIGACVCAWVSVYHVCTWAR